MANPHCRSVISRFRLRFMILAPLLLVSGCVGFAVSVPHTTTRIEATPKGFIFNENTLPRESNYENVRRRFVDRKVIYENKLSGCYQHVLIIPMWIGKCLESETWQYVDNDQVEITNRTYHLFGLWCSPIPFLSYIPEFLSHVHHHKFPFCDMRWGSKMNEVSFHWDTIND